MKYYLLALLIVAAVLSSSAQSADDCLDVSVAPTIARAVVVPSTQPTTTAGINDLLRSLINALSAQSSPFAVNAAIAYTNDDYYTVQSCMLPGNDLACATFGTPYYVQIVNSARYGNYNPRSYGVSETGAVDIENGAVVTGTTEYRASTRPWFSANGWSQPYEFTNLDALSRTYVIPGSNYRVNVDRLPTEPCDECRSRSPAVALSPYVAASAPLASWTNANTRAAVNTGISYLAGVLQRFQSHWTVKAVGVGFENGDAYFVTDCQATTSNSSIPECRSSRYVAEVRNQAVFGNDHLFIWAVSSSNQASPRDEGTSFDTVNRPWYLQGSGWSEYYGDATAGSGGLIRSYATRFNGGVVEVDGNPAAICYNAPTGPGSCSSSPSPSPSTCGGSSPSPSTCGGDYDDDDGVSINFYFADILRGI